MVKHANIQKTIKVSVMCSIIIISHTYHVFFVAAEHILWQKELVEQELRVRLLPQFHQLLLQFHFHYRHL